MEAEDLLQKIVSQAEFYFSDENLAKDSFLLKHLRKNRMGFVSIKLLTSFKKIRCLAKDWQVTALALQYSAKLQLNEHGNKVRRKAPVPRCILVQVPTRLLLVWDLSALPSPERGSLQRAIALLHPFGSISTVRLLRPGRERPPELRRYDSIYPELCCQDCVLVEFEGPGGAERAYQELLQSGTNIKVLLIEKLVSGSCLGGKCDRDYLNNVSQQLERLHLGKEDIRGCEHNLNSKIYSL